MISGFVLSFDSHEHEGLATKVYVGRVYNEGTTQRTMDRGSCDRFNNGLKYTRRFLDVTH